MIQRVLWFTPADLGERIVSAPLGEVRMLRAHSLPEALLCIRNRDCDVVILSCRLPGAGIDDALLEIHRVDPPLPVVVDCLSAGIDDAVRLTKLGACDVWTGALDCDRVRQRLALAGGWRSRRIAGFDSREGAWRSLLVGNADCMQRVADVIRLVSSRRSTVLITGETGTGKEVVAKSIHIAGGRAHLPFVATNCAAIPENLIEAELFGHMKGAFTGAAQSRAGLFEQANGGTVFLDEIGELPAAMQVKLLRVLQEREVQRLGGTETVQLNIRVIAATNADLEEAVRARRFREDLFYRLNVVPLRLPPLRQRLDDVPALVQHFLEKVCEAEGVARKSISAPALALLKGYDWPGNVRQLEHAVEMAVVLSGDRAVLDCSDFSLLAREGVRVCGTVAPVIEFPEEGLDLDATVGRIERSLVEQALARCRGNKARAADLLRIKRTTLLAKMKTLETRFGCEVWRPAPQRWAATG
jgi:DNA-binding NtrC family response regulator